MIWLLLLLNDTARAVAQGKTNVFVDCEQCGIEYVYRLRCTATGHTPRQARQHLKHKLKRSIDTVPCPDCGWYQQAMVDQLRSQRLSRMGKYALAGVIVAGMLLFAAAVVNEAAGHPRDPALAWPIFWVLVGFVGLCGLAGTIYGFIRARQHDPNAEDAEARLRLARKRAVTAEAFDREAREMEEEERRDWEPEPRPTSRSSKVFSVLHEAEQLERQGEYDEAIDLLEDYIDSTDNTMSQDMCYTRIDRILEKRKGRRPGDLSPDSIRPG